MINIPISQKAYEALVKKFLGFKVVRYVLLATREHAVAKGLKFELTFAETHTFQKNGHPRHHYLPVTDMHCLNVEVDGVRIIRLGASKDFKYIFLNIDTDTDGNRMPNRGELFAWKLLYPFCLSNVRVVYTHLPINDPGQFQINGNHVTIKLDAEGHASPSFITSGEGEAIYDRDDYYRITEEQPSYMDDVFKRIDKLAKKKYEASEKG
ncbi:hypothetical protein [Pseudidiomarina mangrovi]|uniref:hypothetical protein n=1 Tax=Pseudidiomarina mangrovi TaxID=2487133 RepID=UPI000FCA63B0|nr:hypothetical protein [Pseudidiomarina mangrovi]